MRFGSGVLVVPALLMAVATSVHAQSHTLGRADAEPFAASFSLINGVRELADGRVIVSDWIEERVSLLDFAAGSRQEIGRVGGGPGEFRLPGRLLPFRGDSTVLVDLGNTRLAVIGADGAIHRTIRITRPGASNPSAVDGGGGVYYVQPGWAMGDPPGSRDPRPLVRWTPETDEVEEIARVDTARPRSDAGEPRMTPGIPFVMFAARDGWAAGLDGSVAIVRWNPFRVEWRRGGVTTMGPILEHVETPVTPSDREAFVRRFIESSPISGRGEDGGLGQSPSATDQEIRELIDTNEFSEVHAPFDPAAITLDPRGRLWITRTPPTRSPCIVDVVGPAGTRIGSVALPQGRTLVSVGRRYLYAVSRDEFDLETLERFVIPRFE
jgi:hypothetical protein